MGLVTSIQLPAELFGQERTFKLVELTFSGSLRGPRGRCSSTELRASPTPASWCCSPDSPAPAKSSGSGAGSALEGSLPTPLTSSSSLSSSPSALSLTSTVGALSRSPAWPAGTAALQDRWTVKLVTQLSTEASFRSFQEQITSTYLYH